MRHSRLHWMILLVLLYVPAVAHAETVLLDFYADWCAPCRAMAPAVDALSRDGHAVHRINIDQNPALAAKFGVTSIPCFVIVENGVEVDRLVGTTTVECLKGKLNRQQVSRPPIPRPHLAWRYERAEGHRAAVVRIRCHQGGPQWSVGSGVLVRWGKRVVVLTARHVVENAKTIYVDFANGNRKPAKVIGADRMWDCAVLDIGQPPEGIVPAEMAIGDEARLHQGDRLESCGYGPDGRLACNSGLFQGYRRSTESAGGPDDWMVLSGAARSGDSGGPVFDAHGRVVGVLWGTDGHEVVCVQPGRVHTLLNEAVAETYRQKQLVERRPTPPQTGPLVPFAGAERAKLIRNRNNDKEPLLPWRNDKERHDAEQDARIGRLIDLAEREQAARIAPVAPLPAEVRRPKDNPPADRRSPLVAGLCMLAGAGLGLAIYFGGKKD